MERAATTNSRATRVQPVFGWLAKRAAGPWPARLVEMADGMAPLPSCGSVESVALDPERKVPATSARLRWMLDNVDRLSPQDGRRWRELRDRISMGVGGARALILEGPTSADCLIECEHAIIWIEGKRFDWLAPSTTWDVARDQLARNIEAVWSLADPAGKDYRLLICHENRLKHHEMALLEGYRCATWSGGLPHVPEQIRRQFSTRIGTLTWHDIADEWPALRSLSELQDLA